MSLWKSFRNIVLPELERLIPNELGDYPGDWNWLKDPNCKYINVRIDMRDGRCFVTDNFDQPIDLKRLQATDKTPK